MRRWGWVYLMVLMLGRSPQEISAATVSLAWDFVDAGQIGFTLLRCTGVACTPNTVLLLSLGPSARQAQDTTAAQGGAYCYSVFALGDDPESSDSPPTTPRCVQVPQSGVATALRWLTQPQASVTTGALLTPVQVEVLDGYGGRVAASSALVALSLTPGEHIAIPPTSTLLVGVDSAESVCGTYPGNYAIDGNPDTWWHTRWCPEPADPLHHQIVVDLQVVRLVTGFVMQPRNDNYPSGVIGDYVFEVSVDGANWGTPASTGHFTPDDFTVKTIYFMGRTGRYVSLKAVSEIHGQPWVSVGELTVLYSLSGAGALQGTTTVAAVAGVATWSTLSLTQAGTYSLDATAEGLPLVTSHTITAVDAPPPPSGPRVHRSGQ